MFGRSDSEEADAMVFCIFDSKGRFYDRPLFEKNEETIRRDIYNMFCDERQARNPLFVNAEDFSVFKIGEFSKKTGELTSCKPTHVLNLHDLRALVPARPAPQMQSDVQQLRPGH